MATITKTVELPAPPATVWDKLTQLDAMAEWNTVHVGFGDGAPEALAPDATFKEKITIMGMPGEVDWKVAEYEDGSHIKLEGAGPMGTTMVQSFDLAAEGEGTRLDVSNEFGGAAIQAMSATLEKEGDKALTNSLERLAQLVA
jgi:carbon monoxide dehydrogenase subunit G